MGDLVLQGLLLLDARPDHEVTIAVLGRETFVSLIERLRTSSGRLGIGVYVIH